MSLDIKDRNAGQNVVYFTGTEVEHTPAYGMKTLFVVGVQQLADIALAISRCDKIEHIYFGANMSFPKTAQTNDSKLWNSWANMITPFLEKSYWCTLDVDINSVEGLLETGLCENNYFIPMISAKLPYIRQLGYNAIIKLDDKGFNATSPGVWCHNLHKLMGRQAFTSWDEYKQDQKI